MSFSIRYHIEGDDDTYALDWDLKQPRRKWTVSYNEYGSSSSMTWHGAADPVDDPHAYRALLDSFGLKDWTAEFPSKKLFSMSPGAIIMVRREKEREHGLSRLEVTSDNIGSANERAEDNP